MKSEERGSKFDKFFDVARGSVRGGLFLISGNALGTLLLAVASIVIARLLGPEAYGIYSISLVVPAFLLIFANLGINVAVVRYCARFRAEGQAHLVPDIIKTALLFEFFYIIYFLHNCIRVCGGVLGVSFESSVD